MNIYGENIFKARDYRGVEQVRTVKGIVVHQVNDADRLVSLIQVRKDRYVVVYGLQVSNVLDYRLAAIEYGQCIMHSLQCAGRLD